MTNLIKSADIQGVHVTGRENVKLGVVRELFIDWSSGEIKFLIVEIAALLGSGGKFHPLPWSSLRYDAVAKSFQTNLTKDEFKTAPSYDREQLSHEGYGWDRQASDYFGNLAPAQSEEQNRP